MANQLDNGSGVPNEERLGAWFASHDLDHAARTVVMPDSQATHGLDIVRFSQFHRYAQNRGLREFTQPPQPSSLPPGIVSISGWRGLPQPLNRRVRVPFARSTPRFFRSADATLLASSPEGHAAAAIAIYPDVG